jgi:hypothetical protein
VKPVKKESLMTATRPGKALAEELQAKSHSATLHPTIARLIEAVASHALTEALYFRLAWPVVGASQNIHHGFEVIA